MRAFTLIMPHYGNTGMLARQYQHIAAFEPDIIAALHLVIVDDCSPMNARACGVPAYDLMIGDHGWKLASFQSFQVEVDIRWNWLTCRNIGALHAKTDWLLMTDIDHLMPWQTAVRIQHGPLNPERAYRFNRVDAPDMKPTKGRHGEDKPHPNTWLMTKAMFDKIGGYDERFSGYYGSDGEFRDRVKKHAGEPIILPEVMIRVPREVVPDASTTRYGRKEEQDRAGIQAARARIAREGGRPHRLTFPYHRVI